MIRPSRAGRATIETPKEGIISSVAAPTALDRTERLPYVEVRAVQGEELRVLVKDFLAATLVAETEYSEPELDTLEAIIDHIRRAPPSARA